MEIDVTEFERIYTAYFNDVFLYVKSLSHSDNIAEEISAQTFFKAMKSLGSFRGECDIRIWLCGIAKNCYFTYVKKHSRFTDADLNAIPAPLPIEDKITDEIEAERIYEYLHELTEPYKEVFMLRVFGELSFKKIGKLFGKSENWACVTYHRAKDKLTDKLEKSK